MSLDNSDPIDQAFTSSSGDPQASIGTQDPIDVAFHPVSTAKPKPPDISGLYNPLKPLSEGVVGAGETLLAGATSGVGSLADALTLSPPGTHNWGYQPRTEAGKETSRIAGKAFNAANEMASQTGGDIVGMWGGNAPAATQTLRERIPEALGATGTVAGIGGLARGIFDRPPSPTPEDIVNQAAARQSGGAAARAPDISEASPSLREAIANTKAQNINQTALDNHLEAEEHGVQLTKGQATRDPAQFSEEQNTTHADVVSRLNTQNGQMVNAIDTIRREASPTNVANSPRENGQVALDDLKAYDEPKVKAITAAYEDANSSNVAAGKGALKLDPQPGIEHATQALEDREELLPSEGRSILEKMKTAAESGDGIPLKQAETWKTVIARATRKYQQSGDTNAVSALSDFRDSLEQMQPSNAAAGVQGKFNNARAMAKARFDQIDADPAYAAAIADTVKKGQPSPLADTFLDDYVLSRSAPKSQIDLMMGKLSDEGRGAVASHALSAIRKGAVNASGNILPNGYNTALGKYGDKLNSLVSPETQNSLESLGRVITNAKVAPPGNFVNYSKSGVISNAAKGLGEGFVNAKTFGLGVPILRGLSKNRFAEDALAPGAGIDQTK